MVLRSTVNADLQRYVLFRGTILAGLGGLLLVVAGGFLPLPILAIWGVPLLLAGMAVITWGLLPYRQLGRLEKIPYELVVTEEALTLCRKGERQFTVPIASVEKLEYRDAMQNYGICVFLKDPVPEKVTVHTPNLDFERVHKLAREGQGCDIFLPYFSQRAYRRLTWDNDSGNDQ